MHDIGLVAAVESRQMNRINHRRTRQRILHCFGFTNRSASAGAANKTSSPPLCAPIEAKKVCIEGLSSASIGRASRASSVRDIEEPHWVSALSHALLPMRTILSQSEPRHQPTRTNGLPLKACLRPSPPSLIN